MKFCLVLLLMAASLPAENYGDLRNVDPAHTKTHFTPLLYRSLPAWEARRVTLQKQILAAAGLMPLPPKTPLNARRSAKADYGTYTVEKVAFEPLPGLRIGANLYLPKARRTKAPAMLVAHGHWKHGRIHDAPDYSVPALCANLAQQGYVAFAYDMIGYNDSRQLKHEFGDSTDEQLWSFNPLGVQLWTGIRALDYLETLPEVDSTRLAMTGASGGGTQTMILAGVDERVKVSIPVDMVSGTFQGDDACEMAPGLRVGTNNMEIAALMAPRPMLLVSSTKDWTKLTPQLEFPAIQAIYRLYGQATRVGFSEIDAQHNYNRESREAVYVYLNRVLHRRPRPEATLKESAKLPPNLESLLLGPVEGASKEIFEGWKLMARTQARSRTAAAQREVLLATLGVAWPADVKAYPAGEHLLLEGRGAGERVPVKWVPGARPDAAVVVVGDVPAAAAGASVLTVDVYQTGAAATDRPAKRGDHLTFHRSDDAERIQDVMTGLAFAAANRPKSLRLACDAKAAAWCLAAAALAPIPVEYANDAAELKAFLPGLERAGGWDAVRKLR